MLLLKIMRKNAINTNKILCRVSISLYLKQVFGVNSVT